MPRTKEANELVRNKKKEIICSAALQLFCKKGYENVTMDEIAKEAKVSHGLVYHYYEKKSDILDSLIQEGNKKISEFLNLEELNEAKGEKYFKYITNLVIRGLELGDEYAYYICLYINFKMSPTDYDNFSNVAYYSKFEKHFEEAQKEGLFAEGNPKDYILCYFHLISSLVHTTLFSKVKQSIPSSEAIMNCLYKKEEKND